MLSAYTNKRAMTMFEDDPQAKSYDLNGRAFRLETTIECNNERYLTSEGLRASLPGMGRNTVRAQKIRAARQPLMPKLKSFA